MEVALLFPADGVDVGVSMRMTMGINSATSLLPALGVKQISF